MLAALLFAASCTCVSHEPLVSTTYIAQNSSAFFLAFPNGVVRQEKDDGARQQITTATDCHAVDVDGGLLYDSDGPLLRVTPINGGMSSTIATGRDAIVQIGHDENAIYWVEGNPRRLSRVNKKSGVVELLHTGLLATSPAVALDDSSIFLIQEADGALWRIDKKTLARARLTAPLPCSNSGPVTDGTNIYVCGMYVPNSGGALQRMPTLPGSFLAAAGRCTGTPQLLATLGAVGPFTADTCELYANLVPLDGGGIPEWCHAQPAYITKVDPPIAAPEGGTVLAIHGSGFTADDRVFVADQPATVFSVTPELIMAITSRALAGGRC